MNNIVPIILKLSFIVVAVLANIPVVLAQTEANQRDFLFHKGNVEYTLPLSTTPSVSLRYTGKNSSELGVGWQLDRLPKIHRCSTTLDQDGFISGVSFSKNSRFCLDGKRLVPINGENGGVGTEYRTELDQFSQIISYGGLANNPDYFIVKTKEGEVMTFGGSAGSASLSFPQGTKIWSLREINTANSQNPVVYNYHIDEYTQYVDSITYLGGKIEFIYEARLDVIKQFTANVATQRKKRLQRINIVNDTGDLTKSYQLTYTELGANNISAFAHVQQCDAQGCIESDIFTWEREVINYQFEVPSQWLLEENFAESIKQLADVNGDGRQDAVIFSGNAVLVALSKGNHFSELTTWISSYGDSVGGRPAIYPKTLADVNGDGLVDIVGFGDQGVMVSLSTGNSFTEPTMWHEDYGEATGWNADKNPRMVSDVNGDGRADIVGFGNGGVYVALSTGDGFSEASQWVSDYGPGAGWSTAEHLRILADVNGDSLADIVGFGGRGVYVSLSTGSRFTAPRQWVSDYGSAAGWTVKGHPRTLKDVNGDGLSDIVGFGGAGVYVSLSTGKDFMPPSLWLDDYGSASGWTEEHLRRVIDLNNDGLADVIGFSHGGVRVSLSSGNDFSPPRLWLNDYNNSGWTQSNSFRTLADVSGDGVPDIIGFSSEGTFVAKSLAREHPVINAFANHTGKLIQINYKPLTDNTVYTKGSGATYPLRDSQPPHFVVSQVTTTADHTNTTLNYTYRGLKTHLRGRGSYGFSAITEMNPGSQLEKTTTFNQADFPLTGNDKHIIVKANGVLKSETRFQASQLETHPGVYAMYFEEVETANYSVDTSENASSLIDRQTIRNSDVDSYGNVGTVTTTSLRADGASTTHITRNTYNNDADNWVIGQLVDSEVLKDSSSTSPSTDTSRTVAGTLPAEFSVSNGSASYITPIAVPPGRGGMQPELSLQFTDSDSNGVLGVGWSLQGLSSIHRCAANLEQDDFIAGVTFTDKDRFCLDGQRLIPISGKNGGIGTEYRTEVDGYAQIISYGGGANDPEYFIAKTKAGQVITFGGAGNASHTFPQGTTTWLVREVNDTTGNNPITYHYTIDQNTQYLQQVNYSGGKVEIDYEDRNDSSQTFFVGNLIEQDKRIQAIRTYSHETKVKEYRLQYSTVSTNNLSVIESIQQCDANNTCLKPTVFEWTGLNKSLYQSTVYNTVRDRGNYSGNGWQYAGLYDANGDGLSDAVWIYSGVNGTRVSVSLSQGNGRYGRLISSSPVNRGNYSAAGWRFDSMHDVNNDGLVDALWIYSGINGTRVAVSLSQGNGRYGALLTSTPAASGNYSVTAWRYSGMHDANGDGLSDAIWIYNGPSGTRVLASLSQGDGRYGAFVSSTPIGSGNYGALGWRFGGMHDVNGDGLNDAVWTYSSLGSRTISRGDGYPEITRPTGPGGTKVSVSLAQGNGRYGALITSIPVASGRYGTAGWSFSGIHDVNSDGLKDAVWTYSGPSGTRVGVSLSQGNGRYGSLITSTPVNRGSYAGGTGWSLAGFYDTNADSLPDAVWVHSAKTTNSGARIAVSLSHGNGRYGPLTTSIASRSGNYASSRTDWAFVGLQDMNADNLPDAVWIYSASAANNGTRVAVSLSKGNGTYEPFISNSPQSTGNYQSGGWQFGGFGDSDGDGFSDPVWVYGSISTNNGVRVAPSLSLATLPKLNRVTDGHGNSTTLVYKPLTDSSVYTKHSTSQYPLIDIIAPSYVLSQVQTSDGVGGLNTVNYHYEGLKTHIRGRGSYGYAAITESYPDSDKSETTYFNQTGFPLAGSVLRRIEKYQDQVINESNKQLTSTQTHPGVYAVYLRQSEDKSYELSGDLITTVTTTHGDTDSYGNIGTITVTTRGVNPYTGVAESFSKTTRNTYQNDTSRWLLGRLQETTVTHQAPGQADQQRRSTFTYDNQTGLLSTEAIVSTHNGQPLSTTHYQYDNFGQKTQTRITAANETDRFSNVSFNEQGRVIRSCNALNQCETFTYTPEGWLASTTGPNGITTSWEYDTLGRKIKENRADGTHTVMDNYFADNARCGLLANHAVSCSVSQSSGSQPTIVQYDKLGRDVRKITTGFDGRLIYSDTEYNHLAQVQRVSRNYFAGDTIYWANSQYDALDRVTQLDEPGPHGSRNTISTTYNGLVTTITSGPEQRQKTSFSNVIGQTIRREEEEGTFVDYTYSADGNLLNTTTAGNHDTTITLSYDEFGRKVGMDDPDMGRWQYTYDAFGKLVSQTDAKGQKVTQQYDILGRLVSRTEPEGTSTWVYGDNTAPAGSIGKLLVESNGKITKTYYYDHLGRSEEVTTDIEGQQSFSTQMLYDHLSRVSRVVYPGTDNFYTENLYNANGFLEKVRGLRSKSEQYDLKQLTPLVTEAISLASDYNRQAAELKATADFYQQKIKQYQQRIAEGKVKNDRDTELQGQLQSHQANLTEAVNSAQNYAQNFYGHLNNTIAELETVVSLINQQRQSYNDLVEQLTVLAEQTLAAADNSFQYTRTLAAGSSAYTELVNNDNYTTYWRALEVDASGRMSAEVYGNGIVNDYTYNQGTGQLQHIHSSLLVVDPIRHLEYQYDAYQNVITREDHANDIREAYQYDRLDRLIRTDIASTTYQSSEFNGYQTQDYDELGNITHKSDIGVYSYGEGSAGPHAVTKAGGSSYNYDANGNMLRGGGRIIQWSSFNKPVLITRKGKSASFAYGADRARYKKVNHNGDTTLYIGKLYEQLTKETGTANESVQEKHYIYANGQLVAEHIVSTQHGVQTRYLHKDALGSVDLITDATANVVDRRSFDAWGKLRNLTWQDKEGINNPLYLTQLPFTNKGFTGHESIQEVGLIHMNGRVYDASLARLISADPHIQESALSQSYNRYSYVLNNPLKYNDPSGYFFKKIFKAIKKVFKAFVRAVKTVVNRAVKISKNILKKIASVPILNTAAQIVFCKTIVGCAIYSAVSTYAVTGSLSAAFKAGAITALTAGASGAIDNSSFLGDLTIKGLDVGRGIAHGVVGGTTAVIQGGKFGSGFVSAGLGPIAGAGIGPIKGGLVGKAIASAAVSGTISKITGGKFANGAATAAFVVAVQAVAQEATPQQGGEVEVDYSQLESPEDHRLALDHLKSLKGDPAVNQASLATAMFDTSIALSRSRFLQINNVDVAKAVFEHHYARSQRAVAVSGATVVGGIFAVNSARAIYGGWRSLSPKAKKEFGKLAIDILIEILIDPDGKLNSGTRSEGAIQHKLRQPTVIYPRRK